MCVRHVYTDMYDRDRVCTSVFAAHAMRDGHRQGSARRERSRSVKDLKPRSPMEETDELWCWCEQIEEAKIRGMNYYLLWRGPPMEQRLQSGACGEDEEDEATEWGRKRGKFKNLMWSLAHIEIRLSQTNCPKQTTSQNKIPIILKRK